MLFSYLHHSISSRTFRKKDYDKWTLQEQVIQCDHHFNFFNIYVVAVVPGQPRISATLELTKILSPNLIYILL